MKVNPVKREAPRIKPRKRVAAYARASMESEPLKHSLSAQISRYSEYIRNNPEWEYAGVYADDAVSGTGTKNRDGFNRMVEDALAGKIDLILTKSVSRLARNTVDLLSAVRRLRELGVEVRFEEKNISSLDGDGELMLSILASFAQEESRSLSLNVKWGIRKKFADGAVSVPFSRFLGYDRGENGELVVNREEAEVVKLIFSEFLSGRSYCAIARRLTERGIKTPSGLDVWSKTTVKSILRNEKYMGCALLQKKYTADYLTKKVTVNRGEVPQYYVEGSHEAIIDPETFDEVQEMMDRRGKIPGNCTADCVFSGKIRCGICGGWYGRKVWHSNDKFRKVVWQCNGKYRGERKCTSPHLSEDEIKEAFIRLAGMLVRNRDKVAAYMRKALRYKGASGGAEGLRREDGRSGRCGSGSYRQKRQSIAESGGVQCEVQRT